MQFEIPFELHQLNNQVLSFGVFKMKTYYLSFPSWCGAVEIKADNLKEAKVKAKKYACVSRFPKGYKLTCNTVEEYK